MYKLLTLVMTFVYRNTGCCAVLCVSSSHSKQRFPLIMSFEIFFFVHILHLKAKNKMFFCIKNDGVSFVFDC